MGTCSHLVIFMFETGEPSAPYWRECAMIIGSNADIDELEDSILSYCEQVRDEFDGGYSEALEEILDASGLLYVPISWRHSGGIPACDQITLIYI